MIRYTVVWHDDAQDQLADIWLGADDRHGVSTAANLIDRQLSEDADSKGFAVVSELRHLTVGHLRVLFAVSDADRLVRVLAVRASNIG